jgi:hypothetical protein
MTGQDNFDCTIFDFKTVLEIRQTGSQGTKQNMKLLFLTELRNNFLYQNNILSTKHNTKQQIVQYIKRMDMIYLA